MQTGALVSTAALAGWVPFARGQNPSPLNALPRIALLIGNTDYKDAPLRNPANDAKAVSSELEKFGFKTTVQLNAGRAQMASAIQSFVRELAVRKGVGLFYYAGHGAQLAWRNYLIPIDGAIDQAEDLRKQAVELNDLLHGLETARNPMNIVILDACRDNPFGSKVLFEQRGLSQFDAPPGSLLAYATSPGNTAADGEGDNGLYTEHLLRELAVPEVKIEDVFKRVRLGVRRRSRGRQIPWESTSLEEDFWFQPPRQSKALSDEEKNRQFEQELAIWEKIKASRDVEPLEDYLSRYPSGRFSELAQFRLEKLFAQREGIGPATPGSVAAAAESLRKRQDEVKRAEVELKRLQNLAKADNDRKRLEDLARAEEERKRQQDLAKAEAEQKRLQEIARAETERRRHEEIARAEAERKRAEALARAEEERRQRDELARAEAEKRRLQELARAEQLMKQQEIARAEADRKRQEELARAEEELKRQQALAMAEAERRKQEELARVEAEQKRAEDLAKAAAERRKQEEIALARAEEQRRQEMARLEADRQRLEDLARAAAERKQREEIARAEALRKQQEEIAQAEAALKKQQQAAKSEVIEAPKAPSIMTASIAPNPFSKGMFKADANFAIGDSYTYRVMDWFSRAETNSVIETVTDITDAEVIFDQGARIIDLLGNDLKSARANFLTPTQFFPSEYAIGRKWTTRFRWKTVLSGQEGPAEANLKITGKETISVPAGTFDCFKIEGDGFSFTGARLVYACWVAPDICRRPIAVDFAFRRGGAGFRTATADRQELVAFKQRIKTGSVILPIA